MFIQTQQPISELSVNLASTCLCMLGWIFHYPWLIPGMLLASFLTSFSVPIVLCFENTDILFFGCRKFLLFELIWPWEAQDVLCVWFLDTKRELIHT